MVQAWYFAALGSGGAASAGSPSTRSRKWGAQTKHVHRRYVKQPGIGGTMRRMATGQLLVDKGALLVDMALVANGVAARQTP